MEFRGYALWLSGVCVLVFVLQILFTGFTDLFILDSSKGFEIWRYLTSIFLHGGLGHLMYNLFALAFFGSILERFIGHRKFLLIFFSSGIFANLLSINFYSSSLGASGAIFGVIGALVLIRPTMTVWAFNLPMPMALAGTLWAVGDLIGAAAFLSGNPLSNTGNIAHLSGMLIGLILGYFFRDKKIVSKGGKVRYEIDERSMRNWEDYYMR